MPGHTLCSVKSKFHAVVAESKWGISPHGIFASCTWYSRGLTRWGEFLGRRRRRRQSSGNSGWHSGWGTIFGVCPYGIGPWWKLWTLWDRGFAQNFDTFQMGRVVWPGEPFLKKCPNIKKMHFFKNMHVQKIQKCHFSEKKPPEAQRRTQPVAFKNTGVYLYLYLYLYL